MPARPTAKAGISRTPPADIGTYGVYGGGKRAGVLSPRRDERGRVTHAMKCSEGDERWNSMVFGNNLIVAKPSLQGGNIFGNHPDIFPYKITTINGPSWPFLNERSYCTSCIASRLTSVVSDGWGCK